MQVYGVEALARVFTHFILTYIVFWSLQSLRLEELFKKGHQGQIRVLFVVLAISFGYLVSTFLWEIMILFKNFFTIFS